MTQRREAPPRLGFMTAVGGQGRQQQQQQAACTRCAHRMGRRGAGMRALTAGPEGKERRIATSGAQRTRAQSAQEGDDGGGLCALPLLYSAGRGR